MNPFDEPDTRVQTTAPLVDAIRSEVRSWREAGYSNVSDTTRRLLQFWFEEDHVMGKEKFRYYFAQREAIETLIYLYEVKKVRNMYDLIKNYDSTKKIAYNPHEDLFPKYCFKMATGSGKTYVMALSIIWAYFNNIIEGKGDMPRNFLIIAPNIAVYERLKEDFSDCKIFNSGVMIPDEFQYLWEFECVTEDYIPPRNTKGRLYLTNVQRLYEKDNVPVNPIQEIVGKKPSDTTRYYDQIVDEIKSISNLGIINDEAHHVWDKDIIWNQFISYCNELLKDKSSGLSFQLDFTATPKRQDSGSIFEWVITDFPLADAIRCGVVKSPIIGEVENPQETPSDRADVIYRDYIEAGCRRWAYYNKAMVKVGKHPIIFFMATKTSEAEDINNYLQTKDEFKGKTLLIHTNLKGEISEKDWQKLKQETREIDHSHKYRAIVSVLMLREGWDVKNVCVIVGLRPFTSKAEILPEQALGRGLRLMFGPESGYEETVDVFGTKSFVDYIDEEMKKQGVDIKRYKERNLPTVTNIFPDTLRKIVYNFQIPVLSPKYKRENRSFNEINTQKLPQGKFDLDLETYTNIKSAVGRDALTEKEKWRDRWEQPIPENYPSVISYLANIILRACKIPSRNSELVGKLDSYITNSLFTTVITQEIKDDYRFLQALSKPNVVDFLKELFVKEINKLTILSTEVKLQSEPKEVKDIRPSLTRKKTYSPKKCILNLVPVANDFEYDFCRFLDDDASDVKKYIKNDNNLNFYLEYVNEKKGLSYYMPDFIAICDTENYIIETKGEESAEVRYKDRRAREWCEDAANLTGIKWTYLKVPEIIFKNNRDVRSLKELEEIIRSYESVEKI
jgi:type III restriction enzyme